MPYQNDLALYLFHQGTNYHAFDYLGVHRDGNEYVFRVWAPHARAAFVVGDFNGWSEYDAMVRVNDGGIFEGRIGADRFGEGTAYKYKLLTPGGDRYKADPYACFAEVPPATCSVYTDIEGYPWRDSGWMRNRAKKMADGRYYSQPFNVYEVHLGSFKRHEDGSYYTYTELARELPSYVKAMGYTHVELMPVMEHPFDGSWGYQVTGYFAPTSRYGTPKEFMALVDAFHEAGIGVILDWVPAHFPKDAHGLYEFDGQPLYEYQGRDRIEHRGWGTRCFDVGREEIQSFLISNATFWVEKYHADGLRVDAVASMLYLDYDRDPGEWVPNVHGDNRNLEAIAFFQKLNRHMRGAFPDVLMIAEESTAYGNLTTFENGGLGFSMKWNMGWMNDTLDYKQTDYYFRRFHHNKTTFSLTYSFNEKYVLPISHDEVVHGKLSLLDRSTGDYWRKFADTRAIMAYMMTHPGKKLLFMGSEYGPFREWAFEEELEWFMLDYPAHAKMQHYTAALNHFYLENPPLYEVDDGWAGFQWIDADNADQSILSYRRIDKRGRELVVVVNLTPATYRDFRLGLPYHGIWEEVFNSDDEAYGGSGVHNEGTIRTVREPLHGQVASAALTVPPLGAVILKCKRKYPTKK